MRLFRPALLILLASLCASPAFAWTGQAHRITALIAQHYLRPEVSVKVNALLESDTDHEYPHNLRGASVWADEYLIEGHREIARWHYIAAEIDQPNIDMAVNCKDGDCIVTRIDAYEQQLQDPATPNQDRVRALKYLVNYLGDIHQPLHVAQNFDDMGYQVEVMYFGQLLQLHDVWDRNIVARIDPNTRPLADMLIRDITPRNIAEWSTGSTLDWANETFQIAKSAVYRDLPKTTHPLISQTYEDLAEAVVELQLQRAGVRIATVLNRTFGE